MDKGSFPQEARPAYAALSGTLPCHVDKTPAFPEVPVGDEPPAGSDVTLFPSLHACETLISTTPGYPSIYSSCSIITHQRYVQTSYSVIIDPLINCLQDIIMHEV